MTTRYPYDPDRNYLTEHDLELLYKISTEDCRTVPVTREHWDGSGTYEAQIWPAQLYIGWIDEAGRVNFGPVRWPYYMNERMKARGQRDRWSASPFPGAWSDVYLDQIIVVKHPSCIQG